MDFVLSILDFFDSALDKKEFPVEDFNATYFRMSEYHFNNLVRIMVDDGLISGIDIGTYIDGKVNILIISPIITIKGLEFLRKYSA